MADPFSTVALLAGAFAGVGGDAATEGIRELRERLFPAMPDSGALEIARAVRRSQLRALRASVEAFAAHHQDARSRHLVEALRVFVNTAADTPTETAPAVEARLRPLLAGHETADLRPVCEDLTLEEAAAHAEDADAFAAVVRGGGVGFAGWWHSFRAALAEEIAGNGALQVVLAQRAVLETLGRVEGLAAVLAELRGEIREQIATLPDEIERRVARLLALRREAAIDPGTANITLPQVVTRLKNLPTGLLLARYGIVPYLDRNDTLARLLAWARDPREPIPRGRLYVAGGGFGKTRLAIEAIAALTPEWKASFVGNAMKGADDESLGALLDLPEGKAGVLLVVDYAESQLGRLAALTRLAAGLQHRIRILALARSSEGWWNGFAESDDGAIVFDHQPHAEVATPLTPEERDRLHADARRAFAGAFDWLDIPHPPLGEDGPAAIGGDRPLVVAMSAYLAALGLAAPGGDVIAAIAAQERAHWKRAVAEPTEKPVDIADNDPRVVSMHRLMAQVTLVQGATLDGARALMDADPYRTRLPPGAGEETLARAQRLYGFDLPLVGPDGPTAQEGLRPIEPDLVGEQLCLSSRTKPDENGGLEPSWAQLLGATFVTAATSPFRGDVGAMLTVLSRAHAQVHGEVVRSAAGQGIAALSHRLVELEAGAIRRVEDQLPYYSTPLARLSVAIGARILETAERDEEAARAASNYAVRLSDVGDARTALEPARRAVEIRERLAAAEPARFLPDLAQSLSNYAGRLSDVGDRGALEPARRAVDIFERLAGAEPSRFRPDLATTLNNYAIRLSEAGDPRGALEPARRAVEIRELLAVAEPTRFLPDLATGLSNYANHLAEVGEARAALEPARRAVEICERLAEAEPARFLPDLAGSLSNYAHHLIAIGDPREALEPARHAVVIDETLAEAEPARFLPDLARSHGALGKALFATGGREQAAVAFEASLRAIRGPAEALPMAFAALQNLSARNLAVALWALDASDEDIAVRLAALVVDAAALGDDDGG